MLKNKAKRLQKKLGESGFKTRLKYVGSWKSQYYYQVIIME